MRLQYIPSYSVPKGISDARRSIPDTYDHF